MMAPHERLQKLAYPALLAIAALVCIAGIIHAAMIISLHVPLDPNEGWNAYHTVAAMSGHGLYPGAGSFMCNNYPPLSFYAVGLLGRILGDNIIAGRLLSLIAYLAVCGGIALAARRMRCSPAQAVFGALYFAAFLLLESDYVAMDDPQMLGHALDIAALLLVLRDPGTMRATFGSAALFVLAGFVKHNLFVLPLAVATWLAIYDRRRAFAFAAAGLALSLLGLGLFRLGFGFELLERLNSPRLYSVSQLESNLAAWLWPAILPLGVVAVLVLRSGQDKYAVLCGLYASAAFVVGAFFLGGAGVDVNAMFDCDIALALGAAVAADRVGHTSSRQAALAPIAIALLCFAPLAFDALRNADDDWRSSAFWLSPMRDERALAQADISFLRAAKGPAMCESLSLCYWAGKEAEVDVFNLDQQLQSHARDAGAFIHLLDKHYFAAVELDALSPFPLPMSVQTAFARNYRVHHIDDEGAFLVPK